MLFLADKVASDHTRLIMQKKRADIQWLVAERILPRLSEAETQMEMDTHLRVLLFSLRHARMFLKLDEQNQAGIRLLEQ